MVGRSIKLWRSQGEAKGILEISEVTVLPLQEIGRQRED